MLLLRILTAVPLAAAVIWIVLFEPSSVLAYLLLLVAILAGYEWALLGGLGRFYQKIMFATVIGVCAWLLMTNLNRFVFGYVTLVAIWWMGMYLFLRTARPVNKGVVLSVLKLLVAIFVIPAAVVAMYVMHRQDQGGEWLLYGLALVWVADTGAYFSGKAFGRTRLASSISPGKTLQGLWGAMLATAVYSLLAALYFGLDNESIIVLLVLSQVLTLVSVNGDLYESYLKRECGIKDSGKILPGHGGMLDRIDSVLAAMPVFAVGYNWLISPLQAVS